MKVGVIQSNYIPWRGYFDFINSVELFVLYDDVQFSKGSWRNRNKLRFLKESRWITIPVEVRLGMSINTVKINTKRNWRKEHRELLNESLSNAPYFNEALNLWEDGVNVDTEFLSVINENLIRVLCKYLEINTRIIRSDQFELMGSKTDRLMCLFKKVGCTSYLSGPAAGSYLNEEQFKNENIELTYKSYDYLPYPQLFPEFDPAVTILDLIANTGKQAKNHIQSNTPDKTVKFQKEP